MEVASFLQGCLGSPTPAPGHALFGGPSSAATHPPCNPSNPPKQSYEKLLRQVITSRLFRTGPGGAGSGGALAGLRVAQDVQLRLVETEAEATTLLQLRLELDRRPKLGAAAQGGAGKQAGGSASASGGKGGAVVQAAAEGAVAGAAAAEGGRPSAAAYLASLDEPPDTLQVGTG